MPLIAENSPIVKTLVNSTIPALRRIGVEETETTVVLTGKVSSYYLKQLAQETIRSLCGQRQLVNRLEVVRD
jgi:hypothetical protein